MHALRREFLSLSLGRFLECETRGGQSPACMDELLLSRGSVADDRPHLIGVHLVGWHQVDQAFGVLDPFRDPVLVFHAMKTAHCRLSTPRELK